MFLVAKNIMEQKHAKQPLSGQACIFSVQPDPNYGLAATFVRFPDLGVVEGKKQVHEMQQVSVNPLPAPGAVCARRGKGIYDAEKRRNPGEGDEIVERSAGRTSF